MRFKLVNFKEDFNPEKVVTNPTPLVKGEFTPDGLFSEEIFGPESDTDNVDSMAWIDLGDQNFIISPLAYTRIRKLVGRQVLETMIKFNKRIDADGNFVDDEEAGDDGAKVAKIKDKNLGLVEFRKNFLTYLNRYTPHEKKYLPEYRTILKWYYEDNIFINRIPVFSPKLRPAQVHKDDKIFQFSEINNYYNFIISHSNLMKAVVGSDLLQDVQLQKLKILYKIQVYMMKILDSLIESVKSKRGIIRKNILAARVNFSARNVITPEPGLAVNEIILNYLTFVELYKIPLINLVAISEGKSYLQAKEVVDRAQVEFSPKLYRYIKELINKTPNGLRAILNRNPSISIHSIQIVKIVDVKYDVDDYVLNLSNNILAGMGADYDGDVLNLIALFARSQYEDFKALDPTYQLISNNDGNFNRTFSINKDNSLAVYLLNENRTGEPLEVLP